MMKKNNNHKVKNPLRKRLFRELRDDFGKYMVIFLMLTLTIGVISGYEVAGGSIIQAYNESFEKYNVEDGNFRIGNELNAAQKKTIEEAGVTVYPMNFVDITLIAEGAKRDGDTLRVYPNRTEVNLPCLMEGELPEAEGEIALDRMYAENNDLSIGDTISDGTYEYLVTGLVALPDYSALYKDNSDTMFDALQFGVAVVSEDTFARFDAAVVSWNYSWIYDEAPADDSAEKVLADDLMETLNGEVSLKKYIPRYLNQAINFAGEDLTSDRAMMLILLYIVIVIMAFVFTLIANDTIRKESAVIGTLRASGYTRGELVRHYMAVPAAVTLIAALVGNVLGYTVLKYAMVSAYYGSYSLVTYVTIWNANAFLETTVIPIILTMLITWLVLSLRMRLSPLDFLRHNLTKTRKKGALHLSHRIPFMNRFRLRIFNQNLGSYFMMFVGVTFAELMLMFGMGFPAIIDNYEANVTDSMICNYQYMLDVPMEAMDTKHKLKAMLAYLNYEREVETDNPDAEKFSAYTLKIYDSSYKDEDATIYGLEDDSRYITIDWDEETARALAAGTLTDVDGNPVKNTDEQGHTVYPAYISTAYAYKYDISVGQVVTLKDSYEENYYSFYVEGIYTYDCGITVYMKQADLNELFDLGEGYFGGYLSDSEITDVDSAYIATVIDYDSLTAICKQMDHSMGTMMYVFDAFAIIMFVVLMYLLSRLIIEKNAQSISMVKILGYTGSEVSRLYVTTTTIVTIFFMVVMIPVNYALLKVIFVAMMYEYMTGWLEVTLPMSLFVEMLILGIVSYGVVAVLEMRKIRKVPMDQALKNVE